MNVLLHLGEYVHPPLTRTHRPDRNLLKENLLKLPLRVLRLRADVIIIIANDIQLAHKVWIIVRQILYQTGLLCGNLIPEIAVRNLVGSDLVYAVGTTEPLGKRNLVRNVAKEDRIALDNVDALVSNANAGQNAPLVWRRLLKRVENIDPVLGTCVADDKIRPGVNIPVIFFADKLDGPVKL